MSNIPTLAVLLAFFSGFSAGPLLAVAGPGVSRPTVGPALNAAVPAQADKKDKDTQKAKKAAPPDKKSKETASPPRAPEGGRALEAWGALKEVKGTPFFTLDTTRVEGKKLVKTSAFVKVDDKTQVFEDHPIKITDLKDGDAIWVLGRPVENETPGQNGLPGGTDRQIQNVLAIVRGEGLRVNTRYRDSKDSNAKWCEATVIKTGPSIDVRFDGNKYKVVLGKAAPILGRVKSEGAKAIKSGIQAEVSGDKIEERPETKAPSDARKDSFIARRLAVLDRRFVGNLYPMLFD